MLFDSLSPDDSIYSLFIPALPAVVNTRVLNLLRLVLQPPNKLVEQKAILFHS